MQITLRASDMYILSFAVCGLRMPGDESVKQFGCRRLTKLDVTASNYISSALMSLNTAFGLWKRPLKADEKRMHGILVYSKLILVFT